MADLGPMRLSDATTVVRIDPAATCPVCLSKVPEAEAAISIRATPGERRGNTIDMHLQATGATVTALPCGHVIHQQNEGDDD